MAEECGDLGKGYLIDIIGLIKEHYKPRPSKIVDALRQDITAGVFKNGQRVLLKDLQSRFNAKWMPIHNSMNQLIREGFIRRDGTGMGGSVSRYFIRIHDKLEHGPLRY